MPNVLRVAGGPARRTGSRSDGTVRFFSLGKFLINLVGQGRSVRDTQSGVANLRRNLPIASKVDPDDPTC
jgi:hypothetical protein